MALRARNGNTSNKLDRNSTDKPHGTKTDGYIMITNKGSKKAKHNTAVSWGTTTTTAPDTKMEETTPTTTHTNEISPDPWSPIRLTWTDIAIPKDSSLISNIIEEENDMDNIPTTDNPIILKLLTLLLWISLTQKSRPAKTHVYSK